MTNCPREWTEYVNIVEAALGLEKVGDEDRTRSVIEAALERDSTGCGPGAAGPTRPVSARTLVGSTRIVEMLVGEQLPRIC